jgi:hypothetical protein
MPNHEEWKAESDMELLALAIARDKAAIFSGWTPAARVLILAKAGRISYDAIPFVLAHMEAVQRESGREVSHAD